MLEKVDLDQKLSKQESKTRVRVLQERLYALQWACWRGGIPTIIVFEGWGGAGKGEVIKLLTEKLDPRGYQVHPIVPPNTEESMKPWMARFWRLIPGRGEMAIFDRSWYVRVLWDHLRGEVSGPRQVQAYMDIREFESMLADDGTVFVKFWLHMSEKEQARRLKKMEKDPMESWKVTEEDWWQNKHYAKVVKAVEQMLDQTSSEYAPWRIVAMEDRHFGRVEVLESVADALYAALLSRGAAIPPEAQPPSQEKPEPKPPGRASGKKP
jgi:polyphosphate kinase 2 (PPK2 family)